MPNVRIPHGILAVVFPLAALSAPGLAALEVRAPAPGALWSAPVVQQVAEGATAPAGAAAKLTLVAPLNGVASAQLVVSAPAPCDGPLAALSDLKLADGSGTIPATAVRVRYGECAPTYVPLFDEPRKAKKTHTIWFTVKVPADAKRGEYQGTATVQGATVPVTLTVSGWKLPDPKDWVNCTNILQSPEAVAGYYKVPLWSGAHFALIEKSFALMGDLGNDILGISAVGNGVFGNDPLVLFRKEGGKYVPELKHLERYLDLYEKHCGKPLLLCVNVWNYNNNTRDFGRGAGGTEDDEAPTLAIGELQGNQVVTVPAPNFNRPGAEEMWKPALDAIRDLVKKRGWSEDCIILGCGGDTWPSPKCVQFFQKIAPYAQWRTLTHGQGSPRWSYSDEGRIQPNGMVCGYHEAARYLGLGNPNNRVHVAGRPVTCNARDHVGSVPSAYRRLSGMLVLEADYDGMCWKGLDYWAFDAGGGRMRCPLASYVGFGNMVGQTPRAFSFPGPQGAIATQQYENLREGLEECETLLALRRGAEILDPPPFRKCDITEVLLQEGVCKPGRGGKLNVENLTLTLVWKGGDEVQVIPQARGFNSHKREGQGRVLKQNPLTFELGITFDRDGANDCTGNYTLEVTRTGNTYTGTYTGKYRDYDRKGTAKGSFFPQAYRLPTGEKKEPAAVTKQVEALVKETLAWHEAGCPGADPYALPRKIYLTAQEVWDEAAKTAKK